MKTTKSTRAKSAKSAKAKANANANEVKSVKGNAAKEVKPIEAVDVHVENEAPAALPAVKQNEIGKVSAKEVLKAAGGLRAAVKQERRGANCTIRLIAERAAAGDTAAVNILCALCDVPKNALFSLNIDTVRAAVNSYYPYYIEHECRKISVKASGVWYSEKNGMQDESEAAKSVKRGYVVSVVNDYLDQLILAAKCRAKGVQPRRVEAEAVYNDISLSEAAVGITAAEIDEAKKRRAYSSNAANVWKKDRNGFYI